MEKSLVAPQQLVVRPASEVRSYQHNAFVLEAVQPSREVVARCV